MKTKTAKVEKTTWVELAKQLGYSRKSIRDWRKQQGSPKSPDLEAWRQWMRQAGVGIGGNRRSSDRERELAENVRLRNELLRIEMDQKNAKLVSKEEVAALHFRMGTLIRGRLYAALEREYPGKVVGRTASEISVIGRELADSLMDVFSQEQAKWALNS